ncbi:MAG: YCF48-related protein, partial [Candidatus Kariarchaeaceae archaeon]
MRRLIFISIFTFFISSSTLSQWVNINPVPDANELKSVYFINDNVGWMVGSDGLIIKSVNAGQIWQKQESYSNETLNSIYFVNEAIGWCVGNGIILNTSNGGENWELQTNGTTPTLNSVQFIDENKGWTVGSNGTIMKTENGGSNWETVNVGIMNNLNSLFFVDQFLGFIVGDDGLFLKTEDGGASWTQNYFSGNLYSVTFLDDSIGWIAGVGQIQKTTDGGQHWQQIFSGTTVRGIQFFNENFGCAVLDEYSRGANLHSGKIITTTDGGINWMYSNVHQWHLPPLNSIFITDAGVGFVIGAGGTICITIDSGLSWNVFFSGGYHSGGSIFDLAVTAEAGKYSPIGVGRHGSYQGEGWTISYNEITDTDYWIIGTNIVRIDESVNPPQLEFINDSVGYAYFSILKLKTYDRGYTWGGESIVSNLADVLTYNPGYSKMYFLDEVIGYWQINPIEDYPNLYKTTNSGSTWEFVSAQPLFLRSFHFFDENNGFAINDSKIFKTTNGGIDWIGLFNQGGREILFINNTVGFVVGANGNIFKTINMGNNWFQVNDSGVFENLNDVFFINENRGFAVGDHGVILVTTDSGNTWSQQESGVIDDLYHIIFLDINFGYVAGGHVLLKTENGGGDVLPPVELKLTSPNGGEEWYSGSLQTIEWYDIIFENIKIELIKGGNFYSTITSSTPSDGEFIWTIPNNLLSGTDFKIKISSIHNSSLFDFSDSDFTITSEGIKVIRPNGGENWYAGSTQTISWTDNITENVKIELFKSGALHSIITPSIQSIGSFQWNIPTGIPAGSI